MADEANPDPLPRMGRTKDDWIERWRCHVTGMALFGIVSEQRDSTMKRTIFIQDIPEKVIEMLGKMYEDLVEKAKVDNAPLPAKVKPGVAGKIG